MAQKYVIAGIATGALGWAAHLALRGEIEKKRQEEAERKAAEESMLALLHARAREDERRASDEARAARARGSTAPPRSDHGDVYSTLMSAVAREALGRLAERQSSRRPLAPLLRIPILGGDDTIFVVLCAAFALGDARTVEDLLDPFRLPAGGGYRLPPRPVGVSAARLSEASAGAVVGFLEELAAHRGASPFPGAAFTHLVAAQLRAAAALAEAALRGGGGERAPAERRGHLALSLKCAAEELRVLEADFEGIPGLFFTRGNMVVMLVKTVLLKGQTTQVQEVHFVPDRFVKDRFVNDPTWQLSRPFPDSIIVTTFDPRQGWEHTKHGSPKFRENGFSISLPPLFCVQPSSAADGANMAFPSRVSNFEPAESLPADAALVERAAARALVGALAAAALASPTLRGNLPGASLECAAVLAGNPLLCGRIGTPLYCEVSEVPEAIRLSDVAVLGGVEARGVAELLKAQLRACVPEAEEGRAGAAAERDGEVAVFVEDLLTLLRQRTRVTPRNAAGREPRECVPAEWTANAAFAGVFEPRDMTRLNICLRASERAEARAAALLERPPLPAWWVAAVAAALLLFAWATLAFARKLAAQLLWWLLPARFQGLLWLVRDVLSAAALLAELFSVWRIFPFFALRDFPEAVCRPFLSHFLRLCPPPLARRWRLSDAGLFAAEADAAEARCARTVHAWAKRDARRRLRKACEVRSICAGDVVPLLRDIVESHGGTGSTGTLPEELTRDLDALLELPLAPERDADEEDRGGLANVLELMAVAMDDERAQQEAAAQQKAAALLENFVAAFGGGGGGGGANFALTLDGDAAAANLPPSTAKPFDTAWFHRRSRAYGPKAQLLLPPAAAAAPAPAPPPAPPPADGTHAARSRASTAVQNHLRMAGWELLRCSNHFVWTRGEQTFVQSCSPRTDNPRAQLGELKRLDRKRDEAAAANAVAAWAAATSIK